MRSDGGKSPKGKRAEIGDSMKKVHLLDKKIKKGLSRTRKCAIWAEIWVRNKLREKVADSTSSTRWGTGHMLRMLEDPQGPCKVFEEWLCSGGVFLVFFLSTFWGQWWLYISYFPEESQLYESHPYGMIRWTCNKMWFHMCALEMFSLININSDVRKNVLCHLSQFRLHKIKVFKELCAWSLIWAPSPWFLAILWGKRIQLKWK